MVTPGNSSPHVVVIGAGIVGVATALYLQRERMNVTIIDELPPAGGSSYGNAGLISTNTAVPMAHPGMLRKVPKWLLDKDGPLSIRPGQLVGLAPWLIRWIASGRLRRVLEISDGLRALHAQSMKCWLELLGPTTTNALIHTTGQVKIWEGGGHESEIELLIARRHKIELDVLDAADLRRIYPGISPDVKRGMVMPGNGFTVSPSRLVEALAQRFIADGGTILHQKVLRLFHDRQHSVMTNVDNIIADRVVIAAGVWSGELLKTVGVSVPLESERGYHVMLPSPGIDLPMPLSVKNRGFAMTSMADGLRVTGFVEFAGLHAPPDRSRGEILIQNASRIFPALQKINPKFWMGHRPSTPDSLPIVGEIPAQPGLFANFGHGHFGLTSGPPSGKLIADLLVGRTPFVCERPYEVSRF